MFHTSIYSVGLGYWSLNLYLESCSPQVTIVRRSWGHSLRYELDGQNCLQWSMFHCCLGRDLRHGIYWPLRKDALLHTETVSPQAINWGTQVIACS